MNFISRAYSSIAKAVSGLQSVGTGGRGWWPIISEPFTGAWQRNMEWKRETVLAHFAVYACINRISNDIGNLPWTIERLDENGIWVHEFIASKSPVLRRPNRYQNDIQFRQWWSMSKLSHGNTYVLHGKDNRGEVVEEYILDPTFAQVLISPDGSVFYQFQTDNLTGISESSVAIPASEITHDRMNCLYHPLVGVSPLYACGMAAQNGIKMQADTSVFFGNGSNPGGVLIAPGAISDETAARLKASWDSGFSGVNSGKTAVLGDGLKFEPMKMKYVDSQFLEQMKFNAEMVCSVFGVPPFKIGMGSIPAGMKVSDMQLLYYTDALHTPIEEMERCQDDALKLDGQTRRTSMDVDVLLRMDPSTFADVQIKLVAGAIKKPDEGRKALNLPPVPGGDTIYLQQQNYSLEALAMRDATNPLAVQPPVTVPTVPVEDDSEEIADEQTRQFLEQIRKGLTDA